MRRQQGDDGAEKFPQAAQRADDQRYSQACRRLADDVSRVVNGEGNVRDSTREQLQEAIAALRYAPSAAARTLAGGEELRIGQAAAIRLQ